MVTSPRRVLVVDDDSAVRNVLRLALERAGHSVSEASSGEDAISVAAASTPDLVILDIGLPGMSGLEVLGAIRLDQDDLPVILLTANGEEPDRVFGLQLGADDYLAKPFSPRELVARVEAVLRRSKRTEPSPRIEFDDLVIDTASREVSLGGDPHPPHGEGVRPPPVPDAVAATGLHEIAAPPPCVGLPPRLADGGHRQRAHPPPAPEDRGRTVSPAPTRHGVRQWLSLRPLSAFGQTGRRLLVASARMGRGT